jgi:transposase
MRHSRVAEGVLKNATVRQERGRWVVSLQMWRDVDEPLPLGTAAVGLDVGVATTIMPSAGAPIELPARLSKYERRIKRLQQRLTRKKKGSKNRRKARSRLARCHAKAVAIRQDFLHKASRRTRSAFARVVCGHTDQADRNAAKNILARALALRGQVNESPSSGCSASTAGHAGTHACEAGLCRPRPRPAAQGRSAGVEADCSLAGTTSGLETREISHFGEVGANSRMD